MSARMPSAPRMPQRSPAADIAASSGPDSTEMVAPGIRSRRAAMKSAPLLASRTAAVASTANGAAFMARAITW